MTVRDSSIALQVPAHTADALKAVGSRLARTLPEPCPGQLWRAVWDDVAVLGVILKIEDGWAEFAPLTVDTVYADPYTAVISDEPGLFPTSSAIFTGLTTPIPLFTLQAWLGQASFSLADDLLELWRANMSGIAPQTHLLTGQPDADAADARRHYRGELSHQLGALSAADFIGDTPEAAAVDLPTALKQAGLGPSALTGPGLDLSQARAVATGSAPISASLAARIAELLGEDDPEVFVTSGPAVPPALANALNHPRRFSVVRQMMAVDGYDAPTAVRRLPAHAKPRLQTEDGVSEEQYWIDVLDKMLPVS